MASEENEQLEKRTALGASLQAEARGSPGSPVPRSLLVRKEPGGKGPRASQGRTQRPRHRTGKLRSVQKAERVRGNLGRKGKVVLPPILSIEASMENSRPEETREQHAHTRSRAGPEAQSLRKHAEASFWVTAAACGQQGEQATQPRLFEEVTGPLGSPARKTSPSSQNSCPPRQRLQ